MFLKTFLTLQASVGQPLPSPNRLKRKILIKNKRLRPEVEKIELEQFKKGELKIEESEEEKEDPSGGAKIMDNLAAAAVAFAGGAGPGGNVCVTVSTNSLTSGQNSESGLNSGLSQDSSTPTASTNNDISVPQGANAPGGNTNQASPPQLPQATSYQGSTLNVHPFLSSMVIYTQPMKFQGFDVAEEENMSYKMSSFPETTALGYLKTQAIEFVNYNKRQLSRLYPKGARVDSSNFMPQVAYFWRLRRPKKWPFFLPNLRFFGIPDANWFRWISKHQTCQCSWIRESLSTTATAATFWNLISCAETTNSSTLSPRRQSTAW